MHDCRDIQQGADMTQRIPENFSTVDWSLVTKMGNTIPPRAPMMTKTKTATPNRMTSASRRSSENPTKTNKATLAQHGEERTWRDALVVAPAASVTQ
jgi:hypothetical protein